LALRDRVEGAGANDLRRVLRGRGILFHGKRHPDALGEGEIGTFLSSLANEAKVSSSTQNQALAAILFLYQEVLERKLEWLGGMVHAKRPARLPVVLSRDEVRALLACLEGPVWIVAGLLLEVVFDSSRLYGFA